MKRIIKVLTISILAIVLLFAIGATLLSTVVNPNHFKAQISAWVAEKTGRQLSIGDIDYSFFPWMGLKIHNLRLSNAPGFTPQDNFVSVGQANVSIQVLPLLQGKIQVDSLNLADVTANLAKNSDGASNWQDLIPPSSTKTQTTSSSAVVESNSTTNSKHRIALTADHITISNANIHWQDAQTRQDLEIRRLNLTSRNWSWQHAFPAKLDFDLISQKPKLQGHFSIDTQLKLDPAAQVYQLTTLTANAQLTDPKLPPLQLTADNLSFNSAAQTLSAEGLNLSGKGLAAKAQFQATQLRSQPQFNGRVQLTQLNLKALLNTMGKTLVTQDPSALEQVTLTALVSGNSHALQVSNIQLAMDDASLSGSVNVTNFKNKDIQFQLTAPVLNVDRYMHIQVKNQNVASATGSPPVSVGASNAAAPITTTVTSKSKSLPTSTTFSALRGIHLTGDVQIGSLILAKTVFNQAHARVQLDDGVCQIAPFSADVYQGNLQGTLLADLRNPTPTIRLDQTLNHIQVGQLLKSDRLSGVIQVKMHITTQGVNKLSWVQNLNGSTQFAISNGAIQGVNLGYELQRALALVRKQPAPPQPSSNQTDFNTFSGSGTFKNGVFNNSDLSIQSPDVQISGQGSANLVNQTLNYHLLATPLHENAPVAINHKLLAKPVGKLQIPLLITGTFSKPKITPDLEAIAGSLLKHGLELLPSDDSQPGGNIRQKARELLIMHRLLR